MMRKRRWLLLLPGMFLMVRPVAADEAWNLLTAEYDAAMGKWAEKMKGDGSKGLKMSYDGSMPPHPADEFRPRVRKYAEQHEGQSGAIPALVWLVTNEFRFPMGNSTGETAKWALERLGRDHVADPLIKDHLDGFHMAMMSVNVDSLTSFLDAVAAKNPDKEARGRALLTVAGILSDDSPMLAMMLAMGGSTDRSKQMKRAEKIFRSLVEDYAGTDIADEAEGHLFVIDHLQVGMQVPEAVGKDVDGKEIKLSDYRGKVVMIVFWATWCKGCMQEIPHERELMKSHADKPFTILGINVDESRSVCRDAIKKEGITWPNIYDGMPGSGGIATKWHVNSFPMVLMLDHKGVIRYKGLPPFQVDGAVNELLVEALAAKKG